MKKGRQFQTEGNRIIQEVAGASAFKTKPSQHLQELVYLHLCPQLVSKWKETDAPVSQVHPLHSAFL